MVTNIYVDGFNFYNRIYRYGPFREQAQQLKWVDLRLMGEKLASDSSVGNVYLFTAKVQPTEEDPSMPQRQQLWWRALQTRDVEIVEGEFRRWKKKYPLVSDKTQIVQVWVYEEKATDVNLAAYLLRDAFTSACDEAIVISNDSDLATAIRIVGESTETRIQVVSPDRFVNGVLQNAVKDRERDTDVVGLGLLRACQLPNPIKLKSGKEVTKPLSW